MTTRVLIADDHEVVRLGLRAALEMEEGIKVVGDVGDGADAVRLAAALSPDVVLMDVRMPRMNGIEATRRIVEALPEIAVVLLTLHDEQEYIFEGLAAGACAYLLKDCTQRELMTTLRQVVKGGSYMQGRTLRLLLEEFRDLRRNGLRRELQPCDLLSPRELEVLGQVVRGQANKEIARELCIDETTVKTHLHRIFDKLDVRDRTQAAILAIQEGWCPLERQAA